MAIPSPASDKMAIERATIAGISTCHLKNPTVTNDFDIE